MKENNCAQCLGKQQPHHMKFASKKKQGSWANNSIPTSVPSHNVFPGHHTPEERRKHNTHQQ